MVDIVLTSILDLQLQAVDLTSDRIFLLFGVSNLVFERTQLVLQGCELLIVLDTELMHLSFGLITDGSGAGKGCLSILVILHKILVHVAQLVKITERSLFIIHDDFLVLPDSFDDLLRLALQRLVHALDIVALRFGSQKAKEPLLLLLDVDRFSTLRHAAGWVRSKTIKVTKDIGSSCLLFGASHLVVSWLVLVTHHTTWGLSSDDLFAATFSNYGSSFATDPIW